MPIQTISGAFARDDELRSNWIERARFAASLTVPPMMPPEGADENSPSIENYQSIGARIISTLQGKLVSSVFPIGRSWVRYEIDADIRAELDEAELRDVEDNLYLREIMLRASIESADPGPRRRGFGGFRAGKRTTLGRLLVCGDTLEFMDDDFRIKSYRNDAYVNRRDSSGDVLYHIIHEKIDPLALTAEEIESVGHSTDDLVDKDPFERLDDIYTRVQWQPLTKSWLIEQEMRGEIFRTSTEKVNPFFPSAYELISPEHSGRGFVELMIQADLRSSDKLTERILEFAALACKHHPVIDSASNITEDDLAGPSGTVIVGGRVAGGVTQDLGWHRADKLPEFSIVKDVLSMVDNRLGGAGLLDSASVRDSERTTKFEVENVTLRELEGALGGVYAAIADEQQIPLAERGEHLLTKLKGWPQLPDTVKISTVTGLAALNREADAQRSLRMLELVNQMDPELRTRVNQKVLLQIIAHDSGLDRPDVILTDAQFKKAAEEAAAQQLQLAAAGKAIDTAGNVAQAQSTQ